MSFKILSPGLLTTIQDTGRYGHRQEGIILSGAMDNLALRLGNLLVGNPENAPALEITLIGPKLTMQADCLLALTGANLNAQINGRPVNNWRPVFARQGSLLEFGKPVSGCRTYLAVAGSFDIPAVLGSCSTYLRAGLGGLHGRPLQAGDIIPFNLPAATTKLLNKKLAREAGQYNICETTWALGPSFYPPVNAKPIIRALAGPEFDWFNPQSRQSFWGAAFRVTAQSDRMGYQLQGPELLLSEKKELLSTAVTFGTVQVPALGNPILLMADHQTTGGYPRLAQVITADHQVLAQLQPGATIRFQEILLTEAQQLLLNQEKKIGQLKQILNIKFNE